MSLPEGVRRARESVEKAANIVQEQKMRAEQAKNELVQMTQPAVEAYNRSSSVARNVFFNLRRRYAWEAVAGTTTLAAVAGIPFGRFAVLRNALVAGVVSACVLNPEYVTSMFKSDR